MERTDITLEGDTLVIPDEGGIILFGQTTRKIQRLDASRLTPDLHEEYSKRGYFRSVTHTPTCDLARVWRGFSSLMLLVSRRCNLRCTYCYADALPNGPLMTHALALAATDYYLQQLPSAAPARISFHGGGEPTLNLPVLKAVVSHIRANKGGVGKFSIVTNGTFSESVADWLMAEKFGVTISWDGLPEVQNRNRPFVGGQPTSAHLERTARRFSQNGYRFSVRMTASPRDDIRSTIRYFAAQGVKALHLEPLFPKGREYGDISFGNHGTYETYAPTGEELAQLFLDALDECGAHGITLRSVAVHKGLPPWHGSTFCGHACGRGMVATHDGHLTACSEVVDCTDDAAPTYHYAHWDVSQARYIIDESKLTSLLKRHVNNIPECRDCYARYACGGGCAIKAFRRTKDAFSVEPENCTFVKTLIPALVKRSIATA